MDMACYITYAEMADSPLLVWANENNLKRLHYWNSSFVRSSRMGLVKTIREWTRKVVAVDAEGNYIVLSEGGAGVLEVMADQDLTEKVEGWKVWERYEVMDGGDEGIVLV